VIRTVQATVQTAVKNTVQTAVNTTVQTVEGERHMARLPVTLACGPYDRTRPLADGRVPVDGVDLRYLELDPEEIFFRMLTYGEFDAAELSLSSYLLTHLADGPFAAVPVFPSRMFRHSGVYVHDAAGISEPADLAGRTVGLGEYQLTANAWIRGILQEYHGLASGSVRYRTGGLNEPGRREKIALKLPADIDIEPVPAGRTLSDLLASGELDAVYSPRAPASFEAGSGVRRLFADSRDRERQYFRDSGIFPIMHVLVMHRRVYEPNRWLARSLIKAFEQAKAVAYRELSRTVALAVSLPWAREEYEASVALLGEDFWAYGVEPNRPALTTFIRYAHEQGMISRRPEPEELFVPEAIESAVV
jgi:4,5-dihydroxyphthalate decarboxylase